MSDSVVRPLRKILNRITNRRIGAQNKQTDRENNWEHSIWKFCNKNKRFIDIIWIPFETGVGENWALIARDSHKSRSHQKHSAQNNTDISLLSQSMSYVLQEPNGCSIVFCCAVMCCQTQNRWNTVFGAHSQTVSTA